VTNEELIEELRAWPMTAPVRVSIGTREPVTPSEIHKGDRVKLDEPADFKPIGVTYNLGRVEIRLDEDSEEW